MTSSADLVDAQWARYREGLITQAWVVKLLPHRIAIDFTCPDRGPHEWTSADIPNVYNQYCRHCSAKKEVRPWPGINDPGSALIPPWLRG